MTVNKNTIPGEARSPFVTSGLRIGTPALTSRGMKEAEMARVAGWIDQVLQAPSDQALLGSVKAEVKELSDAFPLYAELAG
jgi:glycine hydroxymethyltransferase